MCGDVRELFRHRKDLLVQEAMQLRLEGGGNDSVIAFDARRRQASFERRGATLAEAAGLAANGDGARPGRTPVK